MNYRWRIAQLAEAAWWRRYLRKQSPTEYLAWKKNYWQRLLRDLNLNIPAGTPILDVGCGPAGIYLLFENCPVTAVDPLLDTYEAQLPHFKKSLYPWVKFHNQPVESFVYEHDYPLVFCLNAINHIANLETGFKQLAAMTQPAGKLYLSIDAHNFLILKYIFRSMPGDILHPHQHDLSDYQDLLLKNGFAIARKKRLKRSFIFDYWIIEAEKK